MNAFKNICWLACLIFVSSCARVSSPTGGPKDTIPPILVRSFPANEQINFDGQTLELLFSETVILTNPKEEVIVTPSIGKDYSIVSKNNKVTISIEQKLKDSTTYTVNFREAVKDITEKNPARNLKLAFSTGSYIDSMQIAGSVLRLLDEKPMKDVTIGLQPYTDTFTIFKHPPTYFTKSDDKGNFKIDNLKPGLYILYSIHDQNKNLIADSKNEAYAFKKDSILLDHNIDNIKLRLIKLDARPLKFTSARPYNTYFNIKASKSLRNFKIESPEGLPVVATLGTDPANVQVYNTFPDRDSTQLRILMSDSVENLVDTTVYAKFTKRDVTPEKFDYTIETTRLLPDKGTLTLEIEFTKPLSNINFDSIAFRIDSLNILRFAEDNTVYYPERKILSITKTLDPKLYDLPPKTNGEESEKPTPMQPPKPGPKNLLTLGRAAFLSIESDTSRASKQSINPSATEDLGVIYAETKYSAPQVIIQLVDKDGTIIAESIHQKTAKFEDLQPDTYQLRIILDKNANGRWDAGNYFKKEEPEEIIYWKDEKALKDIKLKANYEIGPLLITN